MFTYIGITIFWNIFFIEQRKNKLTHFFKSEYQKNIISGVENRLLNCMLYTKCVGNSFEILNIINWEGNILRKILLLGLSLMSMLALCGVGFAAVGHVGHVDEDNFQEVESDDIIFDPDEIACVCMTSAPSLTADDINMQESGTYDVIILSGVIPAWDGPRTNQMKIDVSATGLNPDGILIFNNDSGVYDYYPVVDGVATVPNIEDYLSPVAPSGSSIEPSVSQYSTEVLLVNAEEESSTGGGGGGGGCSLGLLSPFALLLAVPLVLLRK